MRFLLELVVVVRLAGVHRFASLAVLSRHGLFVYYLAVPKFKIFKLTVVVSESPSHAKHKICCWNSARTET
jgi:hypothetical protein